MRFEQAIGSFPCRSPLRRDGRGGAAQAPPARLTAEARAAVTWVAEPLEAPPGAGKSWKRRQVSAGPGEWGGACGPRRPPARRLGAAERPAGSELPAPCARLGPSSPWLLPTVCRSSCGVC